MMILSFRIFIVRKLEYEDIMEAFEFSLVLIKITYLIFKTHSHSIISSLLYICQMQVLLICPIYPLKN